MPKYDFFEDKSGEDTTKKNTNKVLDNEFKPQKSGLNSATSPKNQNLEFLLTRIEDLERSIARIMAGSENKNFPWETLDALLDNLMTRDQFRMKSNGACNNITIWRMLVRLKDARKEKNAHT